MRRMVVNGANGPLVKNMRATSQAVSLSPSERDGRAVIPCGTYVKVNMKITTASARPTVGRMREVNGVHSSR